MIQQHYKETFNRTIKTCWIADVKRELGQDYFFSLKIYIQNHP